MVKRGPKQYTAMCRSLKRLRYGHFLQDKENKHGLLGLSVKT